MTKRYLVTGGAGFIGSAVARRLIETTGNELLVVDKLTYAGNLESLAPIAGSSRYRFARVDIMDSSAIQALFKDFEPDVVMHLAAESHVDRSIDGPKDFINTNVLGTFTLLQCALEQWRSQTKPFRFHHISTDEVYGSLGPTGLFTEETPYLPNSPYSATKAASDHLVRAWHHTYGLPVVVTNCSNNYGPYHFPEKLIPLVIINGLEGKTIPVYGKGENVRDWLHVEDHAHALLTVAEKGKIGESYNVGGNNEYDNLAVVTMICDLLDELAPDRAIGKRRDLISFVSDRPGHDLRYAIDASKIASELGWKPKHSFESGLRQTVQWYLDNRSWWEPVRQRYRGDRLGLADKRSS